MAKLKESKYKIWLYLLWDDNHYDDWMRRLTRSGVQAAISPLHSTDKWDYDDTMLEDPRVGLSPDLRYYNITHGCNSGVAGSAKKPHRHIVLKFPGSQTQDQVNRFVNETFSENPCLPMRCKGISGSTRYLIHYDNPEKDQFTIGSIISVNGFDAAKYFQPTAAQEDELFYQIARIIEEEDFNSYYRLMFFFSNKAQNGDYLEEFRYCRAHVHLVKSYVQSRAGIGSAAALAAYQKNVVHQLTGIADALESRNVFI